MLLSSKKSANRRHAESRDHGRAITGVQDIGEAPEELSSISFSHGSRAYTCLNIRF
jgi:hypothetical protein